MQKASKYKCRYHLINVGVGLLLYQKQICVEIDQNDS